jgi:hypothetical protein
MGFGTLEFYGRPAKHQWLADADADADNAA